MVRLAIVAAVVTAAWLLFGTPAHRSAGGSSRPSVANRVEPPGAASGTAGAAEVTIGAGVAQAVPHSFLGISTEYWALPVWERHPVLLHRVLSLLRAPGDDPLVLRIGGDSADEAFWEPATRKITGWAVALNPAWLREARALVRGAHVRLIIDLNLLTATPAMAAQWARAVEAALPPRSIVGFEIGNEPDIYDRQYWLSIVAGSAFGDQILPRKLSAAVYARDFHAYAHALSAAAPGVPLLGPALANPSLHVSWISTLLAGPHPGLRTISVHRYPYSACAVPGSAAYPTIARVLSEHAGAGVARALQKEIRLVHRAGLSFRVSELNSVTCGGLRGVSDTFATALWAPDALFELLRGGVDAVNIHVRPRTINLAFALTSRGLTAHPLLYGLILFSRTLGIDPQLLPLRLRARASQHLKAWAVRVRGDVLHVLLIDKGSRPVTVALHLPARAPASVQRLLAPSVASSSGVTLGGQELSTSGRWEGSVATESLRPGVHGYELTLPRYSAALVSVRSRSARAR